MCFLDRTTFMVEECTVVRLKGGILFVLLAHQDLMVLVVYI